MIFIYALLKDVLVELFIDVLVELFVDVLVELFIDVVELFLDVLVELFIDVLVERYTHLAFMVNLLKFKMMKNIQLPSGIIINQDSPPYYL